MYMNCFYRMSIFCLSINYEVNLLDLEYVRIEINQIIER